LPIVREELIKDVRQNGVIPRDDLFLRGVRGAEFFGQACLGLTCPPFLVQS